MKDELISLDTAKLAKEKGYDIIGGSCFDKYGNYYTWDWNNVWFNESKNKHLKFDEEIDPIYYRPTQSLLQKWLRKLYNINLWAYQPNETGYWAHNLENKAKYDDHEEAIEKGLIQALNLI